MTPATPNYEEKYSSLQAMMIMPRFAGTYRAPQLKGKPWRGLLNLPALQFTLPAAFGFIHRRKTFAPPSMASPGGLAMANLRPQLYYYRAGLQARPLMTRTGFPAPEPPAPHLSEVLPPEENAVPAGFARALPPAAGRMHVRAPAAMRPPASRAARPLAAARAVHPQATRPLRAQPAEPADPGAGEPPAPKTLEERARQPQSTPAQDLFPDPARPAIEPAPEPPSATTGDAPRPAPDRPQAAAPPGPARDTAQRPTAKPALPAKTAPPARPAQRTAVKGAPLLKSRPQTRVRLSAFRPALPVQAGFSAARVGAARATHAKPPAPKMPPAASPTLFRAARTDPFPTAGRQPQPARAGLPLVAGRGVLQAQQTQNRTAGASLLRASPAPVSAPRPPAWEGGSADAGDRPAFHRETSGAIPVYQLQRPLPVPATDPAAAPPQETFDGGSFQGLPKAPRPRPAAQPPRLQRAPAPQAQAALLRPPPGTRPAIPDLPGANLQLPGPARPAAPLLSESSAGFYLPPFRAVQARRFPIPGSPAPLPASMPQAPGGHAPLSWHAFPVAARTPGGHFKDIPPGEHKPAARKGLPALAPPAAAAPRQRLAAEPHAGTDRQPAEPPAGTRPGFPSFPASPAAPQPLAAAASGTRFAAPQRESTRTLQRPGIAGEPGIPPAPPAFAVLRPPAPRIPPAPGIPPANAILPASRPPAPGIPPRRKGLPAPGRTPWDVQAQAAGPAKPGAAPPTHSKPPTGGLPPLKTLAGGHPPGTLHAGAFAGRFAVQQTPRVQDPASGSGPFPPAGDAWPDPGEPMIHAPLPESTDRRHPAAPELPAFSAGAPADGGIQKKILADFPAGLDSRLPAARLTQLSAAEPPAAADSPLPAAAEAAGTAPAEADIDKVADRLYELIADRLRIENERQGLF